MSNKTYCFFSAQYLPTLGGVERYTAHLAQEIVAYGNRAIIVTSSLKGQPFFEEKDSILIFRLPSFEWMNGRFPVLKYGKKLRDITKRLDELAIDYVVINTRLYLLSYYGAKYAKQRNLPSILIDHATGHIVMGSDILNQCGQLYEHVLTLMIKRNITKFYGVSEECTKWLKHFRIEAQGVLYNSIDNEYIQCICQKQNNTIREAIDYHDTDIIITFVGRLIKEKGVEKLVDAVGKLVNRYDHIKLCIAGTGELYNKMRDNPSEYIKFLGGLEFEQVIQLLKLTTIYCLPTDYPEGLPTTVLEAIACETYVVTTKAGGSKEIITDDSFGTILENNTVEEILDVLSYMIEHPQKREQAVKKAYQKVSTMFTWKAAAEKLMKVFDSDMRLL